MGLGLNVALHDVVHRVAFSAAVPIQHRTAFLRRLGWTGITRSDTRDGCLFIGFDITMDRSYLNRQVLIDASAPVRIGAHVQFGPRSSIITSTHRIGDATMRGGDPEAQPVAVGDGCWIGAGAMILPGVIVAPGCIIAAGAVVTRDTEPNGIYAGTPARRVRDLD
ncbi:acyltransferase [Micrococcus luteus]|uniref:acyltransferase n=1 Tax=Micrococcus luteus TaxID=1270 RepID=UPI002002DA1D|nr:acyltransferase [Micrococcus luteus]MCK6057232.1 acyltransferase [Micrococcus luteus]MCK6062132.1 acyltransferase [Micrococcus luteus]MCK6064363.1 acyltransferase [Micrococcus luteus]MCK6192514.1 acyltransferase [Micrococcus luteus]MCK6194511.1 acyltransferase [Micrococcus luteus]